MDQILKLESFSQNEYSELQMHMEGLEELKNTVVEKNFHREVEEQLRKIPEALGLVRAFSYRFLIMIREHRKAWS